MYRNGPGIASSAPTSPTEASTPINVLAPLSGAKQKRPPMAGGYYHASRKPGSTTSSLPARPSTASPKAKRTLVVSMDSTAKYRNGVVV